MELVDAIRSRSSIRAFRPDPISRETFAQLFDIARWAPSASNGQPWRVTCVMGQALGAWRQALVERAEAKGWVAEPREAMNRRVRRGPLAGLAELSPLSPYELLFLGSNRLYDAPAAVVLSFVGARGARQPDGIAAFATTLLLAAHEMGLGTCWLRFVLAQRDLVRQHARIPEDEQPAAVIALGYPDPNAPENTFRSPRETVESFTRWVE